MDDSDLNLRGRYEEALERIDVVRRQLAQPVACEALVSRHPAGRQRSTSRKAFFRTVEAAREHIRAMQIIDELENGRAYVQAGTGIVADSRASREYDETIEKSRVLSTAIDFAERGLSKFHRTGSGI